MTIRVILTTTILVVTSIAGIVSAQTPLGTHFTYQGQLRGSGIPVVGNADFQFSLHDSEIGGNQVGMTRSKTDVAIANGLFTFSLDFGATAFNGDARWIEVAVRSPAGAGGFTTLTPRQPLTAVPYALQTRGITVDENNRVGIGTSTPAKKLTVAGDMELGTTSSDNRHLRIGGGSSDGFLYGAAPALSNGIHLGFNFLVDAAGNDQVIHSASGTSRVSMGYGSIALATAGPGGAPPVNRITVDQTGLNVNIGSITIPPKLRSYTMHAYQFMPHFPFTTTGGYDDSGIHHAGPGERRYIACPHLPDGATIVAMELIGEDTYAIEGFDFDMTCTLGRTDFSGSAAEMASVVSLTGGNVWQTSDITNPTIDNDTHAYWVRVLLKIGPQILNDMEQRLTAVRLIYEITSPLP